MYPSTQNVSENSFNAKGNMKLITQRKRDAYDVTYKINRFLNFLCLSGVTKNGNGDIVRARVTVQFIIMMSVITILTTTCVTARFYYTYWVYPWNQRAYTEFSLSTLTVIFAVSLFISTYNTDESIYKEYYANYKTIDSILNMDTSIHYSNETNRANRLFFVLAFVYSLKSFVEPLLVSVPYSWREVLPFFNDVIISYLHFMIILHILVKLVMLEKRFENFERKVLNMVKCKENVKLNVLRYKQCYLLFHKQCFLLNKIHGWQELMECAILLLYLTRVIYSALISGLTGYKFAAFVGFVLIRLLTDGGLMVCLVTVIERITADRARTLMHLEDSICGQYEDDKSMEQVSSMSSLLEQIRRQPVIFTACNFFVLDFTLLQSMFSATVSYIIILTQMK